MAATTYYIDPTVVGPGTGTLADPYKLWTSVAWVAGNTYLLKRGTTCTEQIAVTPGAYPPSRYNRIIIGAYGTGARPEVSPASSTAITCSSRSGITIQGIHAIGGNVAGSNGITGITTNATTDQYILIEDCVVEAPLSTTGNGIGIKLTGRGNIIRNTEVKNCYNDGIFLTCSHTVVDNCYIHDFDTEVNLGDGLQFAGTHNHGETYVTNTTIVGHHNGGSKQSLLVGDPTATADRFVIANCKFSKMKQVAIIQIAGTIIVGCEFSDGYSTGIESDFSSCLTISADNVLVTGCAMIAGDNTYRGISIQGKTGAILKNCTLSSGFTYYGIDSTTGTTTTTVTNCLINHPIAYYLNGTATITDTNNVYQTGVTKSTSGVSSVFSAWTTTGSIETNPMVGASNFPLAGSPLIGTATTDMSRYMDATGVKYLNPSSIGAYEYRGMTTREGA